MTNQSDRQASARVATGTSWTYEGDWHALFDRSIIASGGFNGRMLAWINGMLATTYDNLPSAQAAFAANAGAPDWNGLGTFTAWRLPGFDIDMDFANGRYFGRDATGLTVSRASSGTDLLPTSASGASFTAFGNNIARITQGLGLLVEEARTNVVLNSTVPVTQTTASLGTGTYSLWVNGSGSATSSAGSATITGAGAATQGVPNTFVVTVAGTVTITVSGSLNAFQCELGAFGSSLIVTTVATATRSADVVTLATPPTFGAAYTLFAAGAPDAPTTTSLNQVFATVGTGNSNRLVLFRLNANGTANLFMNGTPNWGPAAGAVLSSGSPAKLAAAVSPGAQIGTVNGSAVASGSAAAIASTAGVFVGVDGNLGTPLNGFISRIAIAPNTALPAATLQAITNLAAFN